VDGPSFGAGMLEAQAAERGFVRLFGGYSVGLPGGTLLVNERIPVPRFNFVQVVRVGRDRQAAFFEAALDHYFQRGLRPSFRVAEPVPEHIDRTLSDLAFSSAGPEERWLVAGPERPTAPVVEEAGAPVPESSIDRLVDLWIGASGREEFRRQLEVGRSRPHPGERLDPYWTLDASGAVRCAGLAYRRDRCVDLEAIATPVGSRGEGAATELVRGLLASPLAKASRYVALRTTEPRLAERLAPLGFAVAGRFRVYALPDGADLKLRTPPPGGERRWRPPRIA
jgi:hypothetical protein